MSEMRIMTDLLDKSEPLSLSLLLVLKARVLNMKYAF